MHREESGQGSSVPLLTESRHQLRASYRHLPDRNMKIATLVLRRITWTHLPLCNFPQHHNTRNTTCAHPSPLCGYRSVLEDLEGKMPTCISSSSCSSFSSSSSSPQSLAVIPSPLHENITAPEGIVNVKSQKFIIKNLFPRNLIIVVRLG